MPKANSTDINIVLDRSSSMDPLRDTTIAGFNEFILTGFASND